MRVRCFHCEYDNALEMRFCVSCGQPLRVTCEHCGATVPFGRFCGNCGVGLPPPRPATAAQPQRTAKEATPPPVTLTDPPSAKQPTQGLPTAPAAPSPSVDAIHQAAVESALSETVPDDLAGKIRTAGAEISGERRKVVVLFSDVSGFTAMSETMDPEEIHTIMNECFAGLVKIIYKYEGYIDKFIGDCIMALFGAPLSHEDDVARALRVTLEMTEWLTEYSADLEKRHGVTLGMHTGINYGTVIAGGLGSDLKMEYTVIGDTVNVASRLESAAQRGQTFVSETVYAIGRKQFEFREVEPLTLKGKRHPVPSFELLRPRDEPEPLRGVESFASRFVGRDNELAHLIEQCAMARTGKGRVVSLLGEPGVGKSRLSAEFSRRIAGEAVQLLGAACLSYTHNSPYYIFRRLLMQWCDIEDSDPHDIAALKLKTAVAASNGGLSEWEAYLRNVLVPPERPEDDELAGLDAETRQRLTDRALITTLRVLAETTPLVLIVDDLHWLDDASTRVLDQLVREASVSPVFILAAYRPEFGPDWDALDHQSLVRLRPLDEKQVGGLVAALLEMDEAPQDLATLIVRQSAGNPYYVEEVLRTLSEDGVLEQRDGVWTLTREPTGIEVPDTLHAVIMGRLDHLPEDARQLMRTASVVGRTFEAALLEELGWTLTDVLTHTERLIALQFLVETRSLPDLELAFKQEFVQEVAYNTLLLRARRDLHRRVGEAIEHHYHDRIREHVELLFHHYFQAEEWMRAIQYAKQSAEKAREIFANASAVEHYRAVLELVDQAEYGDPIEKVGDVLFAQDGLGEVLTLMGDYEGAVDAYGQILSLLEGSELDASRATVTRAAAMRHIGNVHGKRGNYEEALIVTSGALEAVGSVSGAEGLLERSKILGQLGFFHFRQGQYDSARDRSGHSLELARQINGDREAAYAQLVIGLASYAQGDRDTAIECYQESLSLREGIGDINGVAAVLQNLGNVYIDKAEYEQAEEHYQRCLTIRQKTGDVANTANVLNQLGNVRLSLADYEGAAEYYRQCRDIFERIGNRFGVAVSDLNLGQIHNEQEQPDQAYEYLTEALEAAEPTKVMDLIADVHRSLARAALDANRLEEAERYAASALAIATDIGNKGVEAAALWVQGRMLTMRGDLDEAEVQLSRSIELYESLEMRLWVGRALVARANGRATATDTENARTDLERAIDVFTSLGVARDLERAQSRLSEVS